MTVSLIIVSVSLAIVGTKVWVAWFVLVFVCIYISAYAWCAAQLVMLHAPPQHALASSGLLSVICTVLERSSMLCTMRLSLCGRQFRWPFTGCTLCHLSA